MTDPILEQPRRRKRQASRRKPLPRRRVRKHVSTGRQMANSMSPATGRSSSAATIRLALILSAAGAYAPVVLPTAIALFALWLIR